MNVLGGSGPLDVPFPGVRQNALQAFHDLLCVFRRDDVFLSQHGGMGDGAQNILLI